MFSFNLFLGFVLCSFLWNANRADAQDCGCNGDPNATNVTCPSACPKTCTNYMLPTTVCPKLCVQFGCECNTDFVLNEATGLCVLPQDCPNGCGGDVNAEFAPCGDTCPRTCNNLGENILCPQYCISSGGCACKPGYVRGGPFNMCILPEKCPHCRENEVYDCGSACQNDCSTLYEVCPIVNIRCNDNCFCINGYARDAYGRCIPESQCPRKLGCHGDTNAHNVTCPNNLCSVTCDEYKCSTELHECDGFFYCPTSGKCLCNENTILDEITGYCVLPQDCHKCSGELEAYTIGFDVTCSEVAASNFDRILKSKIGTWGCHCQINAVRNDHGVCIPAFSCPNCGPNEIYNECGTACPSTCDNINGINIACTTECMSGCFCRDGFFRNLEGACVLPEQCPSGCGGDPNAEFSTCGNSCPITCHNYKTPPPCAFCLIGPGGCRCKPGYVLNDDGRCILPTECPTDECTCGVNEHYEKCPLTCPPETCYAIGKSYSCPANEPPNPCQPGCRCDDNYKRDDNDVCIPIEDCPNCGGDPNARFYPCGWCQQTCANVGNQLVCPALCRPPGGCGCNPGYLLNDEGICVLPEQCPPRCTSPFEVWSECGALCQRTCQFPNGLNCPDICWGGCVCCEGLLRDDSGNCVEPCECL